MIPLAYLTRYKQQVFLDEEQLGVTDQPLWIEINETLLFLIHIAYTVFSGICWHESCKTFAIIIPSTYETNFPASTCKIGCCSCTSNIRSSGLKWGGLGQ